MLASHTSGVRGVFIDSKDKVSARLGGAPLGVTLGAALTSLLFWWKPLWRRELQTDRSQGAAREKGDSRRLRGPFFPAKLPPPFPEKSLPSRLRLPSRPPPPGLFPELSGASPALRR